MTQPLNVSEEFGAKPRPRFQWLGMDAPIGTSSSILIKRLSHLPTTAQGRLCQALGGFLVKGP